jgi:putative CocE/NonD family hydrolase
VPTLLVGGWQDLFLEQTLEQYQVLAGRGVPTRLLVGPWTHVEVATKGGAVLAESLAWLDRYAGPGVTANASAPDTCAADTSTPVENSVRVWVGGKGAGAGWREVSGWPPAGPREQRWYLGRSGSLTPSVPAAAGTPPARFRYDPADPTPSVGGATMTPSAGVRDNRELEARADVLVFTSEPLAGPVEILGEAAAELSVARDNPNADLFVRLCDVDEKGRSRNVCDGIVRLTAADPGDGVVRISLLGAAHRFAPGHRLRLQVSGGAHPRFARNPGTGQVEAPARDLVPTGYQIDPGASALLLPVTG